MAKVNDVIGRVVIENRGYNVDELLAYYIPKEALKEVLDVLRFGEKKHGDSWKKKAIDTHFKHAIQHLNDYYGNFIYDNETGKSNLAHAICRLLFALSLNINTEKK